MKHKQKECKFGFKVLKIGGKWNVILAIDGESSEVTHWWTIDINHPESVTVQDKKTGSFY